MRMPSYGPQRKIGHFTVKGGSEAGGDLVLKQTFLFSSVNQVVLMVTSIFQGQFPYISIKTRSTQPDIHAKDRVLSPQL